MIRSAVINGIGFALLMAGAVATRALEPGEASYESEIVSPDAFVFSGPGDEYYPTQILKAGQTVTVYGVRRGDWVGVLPPKGSFSWIPHASVEEKSDGTATVNADNTQARVGSQLSDAHHVFQVTLKKGDVVRPLDRGVLKEGGKITEWLKIVPPEDELRYVKVSDIRPAGISDVTQGPTGGFKETAPTAPSAPPPGPVVAGEVIPPLSPIRSVSARSKSMEPVAAAPARERVGSEGAQAAAGPPVVADASLPMDQRIASVRAQVDRMRTRDPLTWDLASAERAVTELSSAAKAPEEKLAIGEIRESVRNLADLKDRYTRVRKRRELTLRRDEDLEQQLRRKEQSLQGAVSRFNAEGLLDRSVIQIDNQPTFTIKDAGGLVTHYVLPSPGLNPNKYVGTRVGVIGGQSTRPGMPAPIIEAQQLSPLSGPPGGKPGDVRPF